ncbi:MAG: cell division protein FtsA [Synergistaceae bacterium]|nr:cell division protein FtsA [Synergistaceae bacterium]
MPGKSDNLLVGLSMGTTKIAMIVAERDRRYPDSVHVVGFGIAPSRGISKGIIVSLQDARQSVEKAFKDAQSITGISAKRLSNVVVAFNAMDVESESTHGMVTLGGRESKSVEEGDLNRVIDRARANSVLASATRNNMYSLHMIPTSYELDGRPIDEPLNMNGSRLDIWMQTVAVPMTYAQNVVNCVQTVGLNVKGLVLKPLASSLGAVYEEEMRSGCISICIGGGTTGIVLYRNGRAFRVISIPIGGDHVRNDLAQVLHISPGEAEHLKKRIFTADEEELRQNGIDVDFALDVVLARLEELFGKYVRDELSECTPQNFPSGIILSGGVSDTPGIDMMLENILQMPVRRAVEPVYAMPPGLDNASFVSAAGILKYQVTVERDPYVFMESDQVLPGLSERSEQRSRQEQKRKERRDRDTEGLYDDEDEEPDEDAGSYEPGGYEGEQEEGYGDDYGEDERQDEQRPANVFQFVGKVFDRFKKLF